MDVSNVSQVLTSINASQNNTAQTPNTQTSAAVPIPANDFGSAGSYGGTDTTTFQPDMQRVSEMWSSHQQQVDSFRRMIETLLNQQAERQGLSNGFSLRDIEVTDVMRAEAAEMIAEGGYFSVEETAARILDFAVAISGGDPARIAALESAVERGFAQAERMFGGEMPEISHQTLAAVREGFEQWRTDGAGAIALLNR